MKCKLIEATNITGGGMNYGKFALLRFDDEWEREQEIEGAEVGEHRFGLLASQGWGRGHLFVIDLATGEGAMFLPRPGTRAVHELVKHRVWVCPLYQPFLEWVYQQDLADLDALPAVVHLPEAPSDLYGYRRDGPTPPFILGRIEAVFMIRGRGCVVVLDRRKMMMPPGWDLHPGDQLAVRKPGEDVDDVRTWVSGIEMGSAGDKQGIVLGGIGREVVDAGDLLIWAGRHGQEEGG